MSAGSLLRPEPNARRLLPCRSRPAIKLRCWSDGIRLGNPRRLSPKPRRRLEELSLNALVGIRSTAHCDHSALVGGRRRTDQIAALAMFTPLECRLRAADCQRMMAHAPNPRMQAILLDIRRTWTRLALEAEQTLKESPATTSTHRPQFGEPRPHSRKFRVRLS